MTIDQALENYEHLHSNDNHGYRRNKTFGQLRRGRYIGQIVEPRLEDLGSLIYGPLISVRGNDLAERFIEEFGEGEYPKSLKSFVDGESIDKSARICDYLKYDFKISPEVARRIFSYAIDVLRSEPKYKYLLEKKVETEINQVTEEAIEEKSVA